MKERMIELIKKLMSFKFVCLVITIALLITGYVTETTFLAVLLAVIAGRESQKIFGKNDEQTGNEIGG